MTWLSIIFRSKGVFWMNDDVFSKNDLTIDFAILMDDAIPGTYDMAKDIATQLLENYIVISKTTNIVLNWQPQDIVVLLAREQNRFPFFEEYEPLLIQC